jgi:hypothetical protein
MAGTLTVIDASLLIVKATAGVVPKLTPVAAVNPVPLIVKLELCGADDGDTLEIRGAGTNPGARTR